MGSEKNRSVIGKNTHDGLNVVVVVGGSNGLWPKLINTVFEDSQTLIYCCFGHIGHYAHLNY